MSENTAQAACTQAEWDAARAAGLLVAAHGTTAQERAISRFAEAIRATRQMPNAEIMRLYDVEIAKGGSADDVIVRTVRAALKAAA